MDDFRDLTNKPIPLRAATSFYMSLKQAAAELAEEEAAPQSPFAVPVEEVLLHLRGLVAHEFKMHQWYTYYAEMLRGENRGGAVELFEKIAPMELEDAQYFLRRISALAPKGVAIPVVPAPKPTSDLGEIISIMLVEEQRAVLLLQHLRTVCGSDPMGYNVEAMMGEEQTHADLLQQYMPAKDKLADAMALVRQNPDGKAEKKPVDAASVRAVEGEAALQQTMAENAELKQRLLETSTMAAQHAEAAEGATVTQQETEGALAEAQGMADGAMQQAVASQQEAAMEAQKKMDLAIRVQQMRQQLAAMVAADPVAEVGADVPAISTTAQAGMQQEAAMMGMDPAAAGVPGAIPGAAPGAPPGAPGQQPGQAAKPEPKKPAEKKTPGVEVKVAAALQGAAARLGARSSGVAAQLPKEHEPKTAGVLGRAGQLLTGSHARRLGTEASSWLGAAANAPSPGAAAKLKGIGGSLQDKARKEGRKVMATRAGAAVGLGGAGLAAQDPEPQKSAQVGAMPTAALKNVARTGLGKLSRPAPVTKAFGGAAGGGSSGMFSAFDNASKIDPKRTLRGASRGELPAIGHLPKEASAKDRKTDHSGRRATLLGGMAGAGFGAYTRARHPVLRTKSPTLVVLDTALDTALGGALGSAVHDLRGKSAGDLQQIKNFARRGGELLTGSKARMLAKGRDASAASEKYFAEQLKNTAINSPRRKALEQNRQIDKLFKEEGGKAHAVERAKVDMTRAGTGAVAALGAMKALEPKEKRSMSLETLQDLKDQLLSHESSGGWSGANMTRKLERLKARREGRKEPPLLPLPEKTAGLKEWAGKKLHSMGKHVAEGAMEGAAGSKQLKEIEEKARKGVKLVAGTTLGGAALSAGTSIHQGRKTREEIREALRGPEAR